MKRFILFIAIAAAFTKPLKSYCQEAKEIAPGVFYYFGDEEKQMSANCVWIIFKTYVLVIDANYPWGAEEILKAIKKTTNKPVRFVFNTHYHHDHSFGNTIFSNQGATIISTEKTAEEMLRKGQYEWDHGYSGRDMRGYKRELPSLTFNNKMIFDDDSQRVELIFMGPAHTAGDGVAYLPKEKILITGDLCVNGNPWGNNVADADVDYDRWLNVLDTLAVWKPTIVVPGHGDLTNSETLIHQRAYLNDMLVQVRKGIANGKPKEELIKEIDLSKHPVYGANTVSTRRSVGAMFDNLSRKK